MIDEQIVMPPTFNGRHTSPFEAVADDRGK